MVKQVKIAPRALKQLEKMPRHIQDNLGYWIELVQEIGLDEVRKIPGYHDEPLKGIRQGQRSIKLNRAYRAIYVVSTAGTIKFVYIEEVSKHEY